MSIKEKVKNLLIESIEDTIKSQIGNKAIVMFGATNFGKGIEHGNEYLSFKIGKNGKGINHVKIAYDQGKDLYDITFYKIRGTKIDKEEVKGRDVENLNKTISSHTGLLDRL
jgi:hypothetical protein